METNLHNFNDVQVLHQIEADDPSMKRRVENTVLEQQKYKMRLKFDGCKRCVIKKIIIIMDKSGNWLTEIKLTSSH